MHPLLAAQVKIERLYWRRKMLLNVTKCSDVVDGSRESISLRAWLLLCQYCSNTLIWFTDDNRLNMNTIVQDSSEKVTNNQHKMRTFPMRSTYHM